MRYLMFLICTAALALTQTQGDQIMVECSKQMPVTYNKVQIRAAIIATDAWITANRGNLPNRVAFAGLTNPQRTSAGTAIDTAYNGLTNQQKVVLFNIVGAFHEIVPPPPPDPVVEQAMIDAIAAIEFQRLSAAIDAVVPGLSNAEKRRALKAFYQWVSQ